MGSRWRAAGVVLRLAGGGREGKWRCGELAMGLTRARERRSGWATRVKWWRRWGSAGACFGVREEERGAVRDAESLRGGGGLS
jgi:hypothetical protein